MPVQFVARRLLVASTAKITKLATAVRDHLAVRNVGKHSPGLMIANDIKRFTSGNRSSSLAPTRVIPSFRLAWAVPAAKQTVRLSPALGHGKLIFQLEPTERRMQFPSLVQVSYTMPISAIGASASASPAERTSNLWKQAYRDLSEDEERSPKLEKLKALLKHDLGKPHIKLRSDDGVHDLLKMMEEKRRTVQSKKSTEKIQSACSHMMKIQDVVGAGASVGGPYVAIPVAALFSVFAVCLLLQIYVQYVEFNTM
jgi:hypothetical protein